MVYKRYIIKNGKRIGPYYYKSVRGKNGKIKSIYLGRKKPVKNKHINRAARQKITKSPDFSKFVGKNEILYTGIFLLLAFLLAFINPEIIGFVVYENNNYIETINIEINETSYFSWVPEAQGNLTSFAITGTIYPIDIASESSASIYIDNETTFLVYNQTYQFDNETFSLIFFNECIETCDFYMENSTYTISVFLNNSRIFIENITYRVTLQYLENETTGNETIPEQEENATLISDTLIQGHAEINVPVSWERNINYSGNTTNTTVVLPAYSELISIYRNEGEDITNQVVTTTSEENVTIFIPVEFISLKINYNTPAPQKEEIQLTENIKQVIITSYYDYQDVFIFTELNDTSSIVQLYEIVNGERQIYDASYNDTNSNGFIDRIEWSFSNKTEAVFEIETEQINEKFGEIFVEQTIEEPLRMGYHNETVDGIDYYPTYDIIKYNNTNARTAIVYNSEVNMKNSYGSYVPFNEAVNLTVISNNSAWLLPSGNFSYKIFIHLNTGEDIGLAFLPGGTQSRLYTIKTGKAWKYGFNITAIPQAFGDRMEYLELRYNGTSPIRLQERRAVLMNTTTNETYIYYYNNTIVNETVEIDLFDLYMNNVTFTMPNSSTLRITGITGMTSLLIDPVSVVPSTANADGDIQYEEDDMAPVSADYTSADSRVQHTNLESEIHRSYFSFNTSFIEGNWIINSATLDVYTHTFFESIHCTDGEEVYYLNASDRIGATLDEDDGNFDGTYETLDWGGTNGLKSLTLSDTNRINRAGMTDFELKGSWVPTTCGVHGYYVRQTETAGTETDPKLTIDYRVPCSGSDYNGSGDWLINTTTICENTTIDFMGSTINVTATDVGGAGQSYGNLTLRNVTLNFNTSQGRLLVAEYTINAPVPLTIINSTIQTNATSKRIFFSFLKNAQVTLINSTFTNIGDTDVYGLRGIDINTSKNILIANNYFNNSYYGVFVHPGRKGNISIINNTFYETEKTAIFCDETENITAENNTIIGTGTSAIYLDICSNITLKGNRIVNSTTFGIYCDVGNNITMIGNTINKSYDSGIKLVNCGNNTINYNVLENSSTAYGIESVTSAPSIICYNNISFNSQNGIDISTTGGSVTICHNNIHHNVRGVSCISASSVKIENNTITSNTDRGVHLYATTTCSDNRIRSNIISSSTTGIYTQNVEYSRIENNNISITTHGLKLVSTLRTNITQNRINNSEIGFHIRGSSANDTFNDNSMNNITSSGVVLNTTSDTQLVNITFINTTFINITDECVTNSSCQLKVIWYLDINVNNTRGVLQNANVTTNDTNNGSRNNSLTGADGKTRHNITEFIFFNVTGKSYLTPYTITVTAPEHTTHIGQVNITQSSEIFIRIKDIPNITLDIPGNNSLDADGTIKFYVNITDLTGIKNVTFFDNFTGTWDANETFFPFNKNYLSPGAGFEVNNVSFPMAEALNDEAEWLVVNGVSWTCSRVKDIGSGIGGTWSANCTLNSNTTGTQVVLRRFITDKRTAGGNGNFSLEPNTQYYFSGWMKTLMRSGGGNFSFNSGGGTNCTTTPITYSTGWTFMQCTVTTAGIVTNPSIEVRSVNANGILGSILIDNTSVTKINQTEPKDFVDRPVYLSIEENENCTITDECAFLDGNTLYRYSIGCGANCFNYNGSSQTFYDDDVLSCLNASTCSASFSLVNISYDGIFNLWSWQQDQIGDSLWWSKDNATYYRRQNASSQKWYLVLENVTVENGSTNIFIKKNVSQGNAHFDRMRLVPVKPFPGNITKMRANFDFTDIPNGRYIWNALSYDVLNKAGFADSNYTIVVGTASVAIAASGNFSTIRWNITSLSQNQIEIPAESNNGTGISLYFVNISTAGTTADLYIKTNGNLTSGGNVIVLNNEKFSYNSTDYTVPSASNQSLTTEYTSAGMYLPDGTTVFFKFFLNVTTGTSAGVYNNTVSVKVVPTGLEP